MKSLKLILPSLAAGGLLLGSALSGAQPAPPAPPPAAPAKPAPPAKRPAPAPKAPKPPAIPAKQIEAQVQTAIDAVRNDPHIPKDVRDAIVKRLTAVRGTVGKRLSNLDLSDMDKFEEQMDAFGEEIEKEMEGLEDEMEKLGEKLGKDLSKNLGKLGNIRIDIDDDDVDDDIDDVQIDVDDDEDDIADKIDDLKGVALNPTQRHAIAKLRIDSDKTVETAKLALRDANKKLDAALANPNTPDAEIARLVDQVSAQEATIRKTRILAWSQARRVLDAAQRKKIEDAAKKKTK